MKSEVRVVRDLEKSVSRSEVSREKGLDFERVRNLWSLKIWFTVISKWERLPCTSELASRDLTQNGHSTSFFLVLILLLLIGLYEF
jgi:hypothetical protein